jgi:membrane-bound ClpP family serine protease
MSPSIPLAIVLFVVGVLLLSAEVFIPSGGLLTVLSIISLVASFWTAFEVSTAVGIIFVIVAVVGIPLLLSKLLKIFPETFIGKLLVLRGPKGHNEVATSPEERLKNFLGKRGITKSVLRPSGIAEIDGERIDVVTEGMAIEPNRPIEVIGTRGIALVVREIEEEKKETSFNE